MKFFERGLFGNDTARKDRKGMPKIPVDQKMKRGNFEYLYFNKVTHCKFLDMHSIQCCSEMLNEWQQHLLFPNGKKDQRQKSKGKRGVDLTDKKALKLVIWIEN